MADYYTQFSAEFEFPLVHKGFVDELLSNQFCDDDGVPRHKVPWSSGEETGQFGFHWEDNRNDNAVLWVYAEECGNVDDVCDFVGYVQSYCGLTEPFVIEWANSCSKPRLDAFGGGCAVIYKGKQTFDSSGRFRDRRLKQIEKEKARGTKGNQRSRKRPA